MENILIFVIICSFGVPPILGRPNSQGEMYKAFHQCIQELHINVEDSQIDVDLHDDKIDNGTMCVLACSARKLTVKDLIGTNNKATLYHGFLKLIHEAYKAGFRSEVSSEEFTRDDVVEKIEKCYSTEKTECEFFICVGVTKAPFRDIQEYDVINDLHRAVYAI